MNANLDYKVDFKRGYVASVVVNSMELIASKAPLFTVAMMNQEGIRIVIDTFMAQNCKVEGSNAVYTGFPVDMEVTVTVTGDEIADWRIQVINNSQMAVEWVCFPNVTLKPLYKNGGQGTILFPFNEGVLVDDIERRESSDFRHHEPEYPSFGGYAMFPNMICSQFMCYLFEDKGFYMGAHDSGRGIKAIDFYPDHDNNVVMQFKMFCGTEFGGSYESSFPIVWAAFEGDWHDGAELYRRWLEKNLPEGTNKLQDNSKLPKWYGDLPLVVTYPVRGIHDMDIM